MTTLAPNAATDVVPLSRAMREGSMSEHQAAEGSTYMSELLDGKLVAAGYADLLLRLRRVYGALEETLREHAGDPIVAAVHDPALDRVAAIDADLAHWAPGVDPESIDSPAVTAYVERIKAAGAWGGLLLAHHYTRYLGDLSGGQAIGRVLQRTFGLADGEGVAFYTFEAIEKPKVYKDTYRANLDSIELTPEETARVVAEVKDVFALNQGVFDELGRNIEAYRVA
ncbi:biliverdin-producing heme oxygenase [Nocardioides faecalis]|uniref:biliverdin-producing heme oxygenase n=1 Tax=Nocardioides faecalis TaxID=2803858 RepID=UPI0027DE8AC8|nr:biliverdin-producing heme oxygenase [Nocardioides faecalis]